MCGLSSGVVVRGSEGMSASAPCAVGRYTDESNRFNCTECPAGRYQSKRGSAKCLACSPGKHYNGTTANSSALCEPCSRGKYGDKEGLGACNTCPTGQYQGETGQTRCLECSDKGGSKDEREIRTNNDDHTDCVVADVLASNVYEALWARWHGVDILFFRGFYVFVSGTDNDIQAREGAERGWRTTTTCASRRCTTHSYQGFVLGLQRCSRQRCSATDSTREQSSWSSRVLSTCSDAL